MPTESSSFSPTTFEVTHPGFEPTDGEAETTPGLDLDLDLDLDLTLDDGPGAESESISAASEGLDFDLDNLPLPDEALSVAAVAPVVRVPLAALPEAGQLRTQPLGPTQSVIRQARRALVVSGDVEERMYLRTRLALARLVWMDEATSTTQALATMEDQPHVLAFFNLDSPAIDAWTLAERFRKAHPSAMVLATTTAFANDSAWNPLSRWRWHRLGRQARAAGFDEVLAKPFRVSAITRIMAQYFPKK